MQTIFSSGKSFESAALAILHSKGLFEYDDKVTKYWPEFGQNGKEDIKISDVCQHRAGLANFPEVPSIKDTWTEKLEKQFLDEDYDVEVVNAGIDGQSTIGHINNFEDWFPYVKNLKPKFIVFYIGLNEHRSESFLKYDNLNKNITLIGKLKKVLKKNNGIFSNLIRKINQKKVLDHNNFNKIFVHSPDIKKKYDIKNLNKESPYDDEFDLWLGKDFNLRLNQLVQYTYKMNAKPIFISQKSRRWFFDNNNLFEAFDENMKKYKKSQSYFYKEKRIDQEIKNFTDRNNLNFISGFKNFEFKEEFFYDYTHTNIIGSEYISRILYPFLKKIYVNNI